MTVVGTRGPTAALGALVLVLVLLGTPAAHADPDDAAGARSWQSEHSTREAQRGYPVGRTLSPITPRIAARLRAIAGATERRDRVFAKVGDSMSESRAFLTCFSGDDVDLAGRSHLRETLQFFRRGEAGGVDPFARRSEATGVGWRAMSVLRGPLDRELRALRPRFATLMLGTNDMQAGRPWVFARRMWRIVERLVDEGTIPIMSSILPRSDDPARDAQVPLYSLVARALAEGYGVPFIDYRREMERLPRRGLARDGLHANVHVVDGRSRPCDFTGEGLRHGHNVRNLLHLRMLHRLRAVVLDGEAAPDEAMAALPGDGTVEAPIEIDRLPFTALADGPRAYQIAMGARSRVAVRAFARSGPSPELALDGETGSGRHGVVVDLAPGAHALTVQPGDMTREYMLLVDRVLPEPVRTNPYAE